MATKAVADAIFVKDRVGEAESFDDLLASPAQESVQGLLGAEVIALIERGLQRLATGVVRGGGQGREECPLLGGEE